MLNRKYFWLFTFIVFIGGFAYGMWSEPSNDRDFSAYAPIVGAPCFELNSVGPLPIYPGNMLLELDGETDIMLSFTLDAQDNLGVNVDINSKPPVKYQTTATKGVPFFIFKGEKTGLFINSSGLIATGMDSSGNTVRVVYGILLMCPLEKNPTG